MPEETPKDEGVEDSTASGDAGQDEPSSEEYVSMDDFKAFGESIVAQIKDAGQANRQSQSDKIKHEVGEGITAALAAALKPSQPAESQSEPEPEADTPPKDEPPADPPQSFGLEGEIKAILDKNGLDAETPELVAYIEENAGKAWWEVGPGFAELAETVGARDGAIQAGPGAGAAPRPDLEQEYIGKVHELRAKVVKGELKRFAVRTLQDALRNEYFGKGVNVDNIVFNLDGTTGVQRQEDIASQ